MSWFSSRPEVRRACSSCFNSGGSTTRFQIHRRRRVLHGVVVHDDQLLNIFGYRGPCVLCELSGSSGECQRKGETHNGAVCNLSSRSSYQWVKGSFLGGHHSKDVSRLLTQYLHLMLYRKLGHSKRLLQPPLEDPLLGLESFIRRTHSLSRSNASSGSRPTSSAVYNLGAMSFPPAGLLRQTPDLPGWRENR